MMPAGVAIAAVYSILLADGRDPRWLRDGRGIVARIAGRRVVVVTLGAPRRP